MAYGHYNIPAEHIPIDMHPAGSADAGLIIIAHEDSARIKRKRAQHKMHAAFDVCYLHLKQLMSDYNEL